MEQRERPLTLRVHQVSKLLSVPRSTIYWWIKRGSLPSIKIDTVVLVAYDDFDAFLEAHRRGERTSSTELTIKNRMASGPAGRPVPRSLDQFAR